ncbi:GtrA family protein [Gracilibacillus salinarum]|uniref:GtrA family protein n=1 Tax=Gracilibacillus salinarum TaxID=2932255 RepID=A0ABY4GRN9_9BACI|nr:GtrA family protein [Gracilibacillus salinarum]UOQ87042.1 GtrA family protein [Gracilibacillus salinarum]
MKINREIFNYIVFGVLTTLVNIAVYALFTKVFSLNYQVATVNAWIAAVLFAYYTNKKYVFKAKDRNLKQLVKSFLLFVYYRVLSLVIDLLVMYLLIEILSVDDMVTKVIANIVVIIFNYITSKLFVFKKETY